MLYGCDMKGRDSAQYVIDEGLPAELAELVDDLDGFLTGVIGASA